MPSFQYPPLRCTCIRGAECPAYRAYRQLHGGDTARDAPSPRTRLRRRQTELGHRLKLATRASDRIKLRRTLRHVTRELERLDHE